MLVLFILGLFWTTLSLNAETRKTVDYQDYQNLKPTIPLFTQVHPPLKVKNITMIGTVGPHGVQGWQGRILRGLRFKDAAQAVENRYNLPEHLVLAMLIHETNGADVLPNGGGDGGFGICHMQGSTAKRFGLKTYGGCYSLVCNGRNNGKRGSCTYKGSFVNHAAQLHSIIKRENFDRSRLVQYDDRLQPILCLDAVGRMLAEAMDKPSGSNPYLKSVGPMRRSLYRYSGRKEYFGKIAHIMRLLEDEKFLRQLRVDFNKVNSSLTINGQKAGFDEYIALMSRDLENFGLREYKKLPTYRPKNSDTVLATYKRYIR